MNIMAIEILVMIGQYWWTATFKGKPVMLIGHEKGKDTKIR